MERARRDASRLGVPQSLLTLASLSFMLYLLELHFQARQLRLHRGQPDIFISEPLNFLTQRQHL